MMKKIALFVLALTITSTVFGFNRSRRIHPAITSDRETTIEIDNQCSIESLPAELFFHEIFENLAIKDLVKYISPVNKKFKAFVDQHLENKTDQYRSYKRLFKKMLLSEKVIFLDLKAKTLSNNRRFKELKIFLIKHVIPLFDTMEKKRLKIKIQKKTINWCWFITRNKPVGLEKMAVTVKKRAIKRYISIFLKSRRKAIKRAKKTLCFNQSISLPYSIGCSIPLLCTIVAEAFTIKNGLPTDKNLFPLFCVETVCLIIFAAFWFISTYAAVSHCVDRIDKQTFFIEFFKELDINLSGIRKNVTITS